MHRLVKCALFAVALPLLVTGCARGRDPINRVQPNYVDKSQFLDLWYYQRTVVDMPAANGYTFIGATDQKGVTRITWDIQQDFLYARRHTELIKGADNAGTIEQNNGRYQGEVVAAFRIQRHFDIMRPYNDTTGEELNVLSENDVDRPWYERRYMRVDWSRNLVGNYSLDFEKTSVESIPYFVQEFDPVTGERNPDAPFFEFDKGYFDVTTKLFAQGGTTDVAGRGKIPLCWLDELVECGSAEYTIRHSFKKLDPNDKSFEPTAYKGAVTELFGYFWTDRLVYDPRTGIMEQGRQRYLNHVNLWKMDGTERVAKPLVYHLNRDWPKDDKVMRDAARLATDQWNESLKEAVAATGKEVPERMLILCENNPVREGDPAECGAAGDAPRIGDLRYSFIAYLPKYMTYGLLGFGPSNVDPETGQILSANVYLYHHNNIAAFRTQEMVDLLNGTMATQNYIDDVDLAAWRAKANGAGELRQTYDLGAAATLVKSLSDGPSARYWDAWRRPPTAMDEAIQRQQGLNTFLKPYLDDMHNTRTFLRGDTDTSRGKLAQLKDTEVESMLLNDEIYAGVGIDPRLPIDDVAKANASVARAGFAMGAEELARVRTEFAERRGFYLPEMADDAMLGLAKEIAQKKLPPNEVYDIIRKTIFRTVLAHELGHTFGLTHNFGGSDDAINYFDDYWRIRAEDGTVQPRVIDPITPREVEKKIYSHAYSSIMDYAARYTLEEGGPGKYDRAALKFGYAGKVEVFKNTAGVPLEDFRDWHERDGDILRMTQSGPQAVHYTTFYNRMGENLYRAENRRLVDVTELTADLAGTKDGLARVPYIFCGHNRADLTDHCLSRDFGADPAERMKNLLDEIDTWYVTRSFPRGIVGSSYNNYVTRYYNNVYGRLKHWADQFGLYKELLPRFYNASQLSAFYSDPVHGWGSQVWSVQNGFNKLIQTILMPDVGSYASTLGPDGLPVMRKTSPERAQATLNVETARFYQTGWDSTRRDCGYAWWECLHHVGFYLDKVMAMEALSDTQTNFLARATPEDIRKWRIGYYGIFADQIGTLNTAILGQDWSKVGPYLQGGELVFPNYAGTLSESHANPVDPFATFSVQVYWQVLGLARFPSSFNQSFVDESRLFIMGTGAAPQAENDWIVTYRDPFSGLSYGALSFNKMGAGEAIIKRANMLLARSEYCDANRSTQTPEDNCVEPAAGHTRASATAMLLDHNELIRSLLAVNMRMNLGDPYNPQRP